MKLVIVHYHLRPGGIRRVIELATPQIVRAAHGGITTITLASGELPDRKWRGTFERACGRAPVEFLIESAFGYISEQRRPAATLRRRIRCALDRLLNSAAANHTVVWAHNLGLARNLIFTQELNRACEERRIPLLAHHHDWWFDNRWQRWPEARRAGFHSLNAIAQVIFGPPHPRHLTVNHADAAILRRHLRRRLDWLPNPAEPTPPPPLERVRFARDWLRHRVDHDAPMWLLPCRLLRRKNVAEALLLARWLRPEGWLVTTGGVSSADEQAYFKKLDAAAREHHWRLRLGVLAGDETRKPTVGELLAASEAVLLTSIQEGFGLPYLEATAARRPLIARALPNIAPDLEKFGFRFPQYYGEILVGTDLFDWNAESARQRHGFQAWLRSLPAEARKLANQPHILTAARRPETVPFSRLTLTGQLQVLAQPVAQSWKICAPLNPFLKTWWDRAESGRLRVAAWPRGAARWLSGKSYGQNFLRAYEAAAAQSAVQSLEAGGWSPESKVQPHSQLKTQEPRLQILDSAAAEACQADFIRHKLHPEFLYPLLWSRDS